MGIDANAKLLFGFPFEIPDNDELIDLIDNDWFSFIWRNPAEYTDGREVYIRLTDYDATDYTAELLGDKISSKHRYDLNEIEEFCKNYKIPYQAPAWYLIPYYY